MTMDLQETRPLTEAQEGLWYFQALDPANPILNTGQYLDLRGEVDLAALREAVARTIAESEALSSFAQTKSGEDLKRFEEARKNAWKNIKKTF